MTIVAGTLYCVGSHNRRYLAQDIVAAMASDAIPITPSLLSPPESKTPPTDRSKRQHTSNSGAMTDRHSEPVDPSALNKALEDFEQAGRRERTPTSSPMRKRQRVGGGDR